MALYIRNVISNLKIRTDILQNSRRFSFIQSRIKYIKGIKSNIGVCPVVSSIHISHISLKRRKTAEERKSPKAIEFPAKSKAEIIDVWRNITVDELAQILKQDQNYVFDLFLGNIKGRHTMISDLKELQNAIRRGGKRMRIIAKPQVENKDLKEKDVCPRPPALRADLKPRPPIVTVMGHVDHGKTTLLDALRHSSVVEQEFGGITQHIGAFSVQLDSGAKVTFLDTPGHAAFSAMRARGANLTDIVVLVVAADDGVMQQTDECIKMAKQANVPILVAINKIDSPKANVERTEEMLMQRGVQVEKLGGDTQAVCISALKRINLEQLTEALVLQAELMEIGGDPKGLIEAVVIESHVNQHRGCLCTVIIQRGTLKKGNILIAGTSICKVRSIRDAQGKLLESVEPGYPAEVEGWKDLPTAGELVLQVDSEKQARDISKYREDKRRLEKLGDDVRVITAKAEQHQKEYKEILQLRRRIGRYKLRPDGPRKPESAPEDNSTPTLNFILKADVDGTLEAILETLSTYYSPQCEVDIIHYGVGAITENDIELAQVFKGIIYAFNVSCHNRLQEEAKAAGVDIKHCNVIYKLIDTIKEDINARLPLKQVETVLGEAIVLQQFLINEGRRKVPVAGCHCEKGVLNRNSLYRLIRNGQKIHEGSLVSMRYLKTECDTIKTESDCGLQFADRSVMFEANDLLICYENKMETQTIDWDPGF